MVNYDGDAIMRLAMRLMIYTFVRTSELTEAEWTELQLDNFRWDIPAERMKMDWPHIVPLSMQSVDVLRALKLLMQPRRSPGSADGSAGEAVKV
jgi:integrase